MLHVAVGLSFQGRHRTGYTGHGENGTLGRLHDGLVGGLHTGVEGGGEIGAVAFLLALESLGKAPEQQGENDAGVAAGAPQQRRSRGVGGLG